MGHDAGMGVELLTERHAEQIAGVLGCWDRVLIFGTLPGVCYVFRFPAIGNQLGLLPVGNMTEGVVGHAAVDTRAAHCDGAPMLSDLHGLCR